MKIDRRQFLASACTLTALARMEAPLAVAAELPPGPPFLALRKFIEPGNDEFRGETEAMEIARTMEAALRSGVLPGGSAAAGQSPLPASYGSVAPDVREAVYGGEGNLAEAWRKWTSSFGEIRRARVYPLPGDIVRYEIVSETGGTLLQRTGEWKLKWAGGAVADLRPVFEHVCHAAKPMFEDVTGAVLGGVASFDEQLARGVPYWRARLDPATGIDIYGSNGIAAGDIDGDGEDEIYVCQPGGLPNRLYKIRDDGTWEDITAQWEVDLLDDTSCALFLDLRNSGRQDLVVLRGAGPVLYLNEGTRFRMRADAFRFARTPAGGFTGMAAADYDRDGKLDLYLCCYVYFQTEAQYTYPAPYADARNGPPNFLFRNRLEAGGGGFFEDATDESGMNENNNRFSFAPAWCDYNGDGWPDLYVANDFGRKNLYRNDKGHFRDVAAAGGVDDVGPGMSAAWFDYDGDGRPDLYVSNMWSDAGRRVVNDPAFAPGRGTAAELYRRHTKGNSLYRNRGDGTFEETTAAQGVAMGRWAWASGGHDLDNDGHPEILVTCGMFTNRSPEDLMGFFWRQVVARSPVEARPSMAYENGWNALNQFAREDYSWDGNEPNVLFARRGGRYYDFSGLSGFDFADDSRAFAIADIDGDGRPDVILKSRLGPQIRVLRNQCAGENRSIAFVLRGSTSNRDAIGARVEADGRVKWVEAGSGFLSQHSKRLIFGLGRAERVEHVRIVWPAGGEQTLGPLEAGSTYTIVENSAAVHRQPFRPRREWPAKPVAGDNRMDLHETWFVEPIPLPSPQTGPGLLVLLGAGRPSLPQGVPVSAVMLSGLDRASREKYEIFRRYLFDWRTGLEAPLSFLLDRQGRAVKIYPAVPGAEAVRADLAALSQQSIARAFPFPGATVRTPRRDYFKMGAAFLWHGYPDEALPYLSEALRQTPDNARVSLLVGQIHLRAGSDKDAERFLRRAIELKPDSAQAWNEMGGVYEARSDWKQALACYDKALAIQPGYTDALVNSAQAADKVGDAARAEADYRKALESNPSSAEAANGLGLILGRKGETAQAKRLFEKAIELRRDYGSAINNLGVLYMRNGQVSDAVAAFEYGIGAAPDEDILYLNLGRIYLQTGRRDKAREVMEKLLARKPGNETALRGLRELGQQ